MPFLNQGKTNWKYIIILVILAVVVGGGILSWKYLQIKQELTIKNTQIEQLNKQIEDLKKQIADLKAKKIEEETADWKTYRNEKYMYEINYLKEWEIDEVSWGVKIFHSLNDNQYTCQLTVLTTDVKNFEGTEPDGFYIASGYYYKGNILYFEPGTKVFSSKEKTSITGIPATKFSNSEFSNQGVYFFKKEKDGKELYFNIFYEALLFGTHDPIIVKEHECGEFFDQLLSTFKFIEQGIKTGKVEINYEKMAEWQKSVDEGHQPWRLNSLMVLRAEMGSYGFNPDEDFKTLSYSDPDIQERLGEVSVEITHEGKAYIITLIQPIPGDGKIWTISEIEFKK